MFKFLFRRKHMGLFQPTIGVLPSAGQLMKNMLDTQNNAALVRAQSAVSIWHQANSNWIANGGQGPPPPIPTYDIYTADAQGDITKSTAVIPDLTLATMPVVITSPSTGTVNTAAQNAADQNYRDQQFMLYQTFILVQKIAAKLAV
jgi:hypothetical protein